MGVRKESFLQKWSLKGIIFFNSIIFWLWKYTFGTFWGLEAMSIHKIQQFHLTTVFTKYNAIPYISKSKGVNASNLSCEKAFV